MQMGGKHPCQGRTYSPPFHGGGALYRGCLADSLNRLNVPMRSFGTFNTKLLTVRSFVNRKSILYQCYKIIRNITQKEGANIMLDKSKCKVLLQQREKEVGESDIYLRILKHANEYIEMEKASTLNPFKKIKLVKKKKEQIEKSRLMVSKLYGIEKIGKGENSEIAFLLTFESHIKSLKEDIEVLKRYLVNGDEFESLPSSNYDKGRLKL